MSGEKDTSGKARRGPTTIARAYFAALSAHDLDAAEALWKPGSIDRAVGVFEFPVPGRAFRDWFGGLMKAVPDLSFEVISVTAQKDTAAVRWIARGTFDGTGKFEGLRPTGATIEVAGCDVVTVQDGQIVANHGYLNGADMARQLGALPPQGSPAERAMTAALNAKTTTAKKLQDLRNR
jgi:predicted ester cyclase